MKKYLLFIGTAGLLMFQSCKEVGPNIDFGPGVQAGEDTVFTIPAPEAPQTKKVLAEEFTGVSCPPCPTGHEKMKAINEEINGNLITIAYHIFNYPQAAPVEKDGEILTKDDFRTEEATEIGATIYGGIGQMPLAGFDRVSVGGSISLNTGAWSAAATAQAAEPTPVNIHIETTLDEDAKTGTAKVTLSYTADVNLKENINVAIVEDSIVDAQKKGLDVLKEYVHKHTLRKLVTPSTGEIVPPKVEPKTPGKTYERTFKFDLDPKWHLEHCHVVVFINANEADDRHIIHAEEAKLKN